MTAVMAGEAASVADVPSGSGASAASLHSAPPAPSAMAATAAAAAARAPARAAASGSVAHSSIAPHVLHIRTDQTGFCLVALAQLLMWLSQLSKSETLCQKLQPMMVLVLQLLAVVLSLRWQRLYSKHRTWLLPLLRITPMLVPSARSTKVGSALVLEKPAHPGLRGLVANFGHLNIGTRIILVSLQGICQTLPPAAALLTQLALAALTFNSRAYCDTELMHHPLSVQRLATAATALEYMALPLGAVMPVAGQILPPPGVISGQAPADLVCQAVISWAHVALGVVLVLLVSVWSYSPSPQQQEQQGQRRAPAEPGGTRLRRFWGSAAAAAEQADRFLHHLLGTQRLFVAWHLLAATWVWARSLARLH